MAWLRKFVGDFKFLLPPWQVVVELGRKCRGRIDKGGESSHKGCVWALPCCDLMGITSGQWQLFGSCEWLFFGLAGVLSGPEQPYLCPRAQNLK